MSVNGNGTGHGGSAVELLHAANMYLAEARKLHARTALNDDEDAYFLRLMEVQTLTALGDAHTNLGMAMFYLEGKASS